MGKCTIKHTKFQPTDREWRCPKCGSEDMVIEDSDNFDCDKLHNTDFVYCDNCRGEFSGMLKRRTFEIVWVDALTARGLDFDLKADKILRYEGRKITVRR